MEEQIQQTTENKSHSWLWILLILVIISIAIGLYFYFSGGNDAGTTTSVSNQLASSGSNSIPQPPALPSS